MTWLFHPWSIGFLGGRSSSPSATASILFYTGEMVLRLEPVQ